MRATKKSTCWRSPRDSVAPSPCARSAEKRAERLLTRNHHAATTMFRPALVTLLASLRATVEHGHANVRSDNYFSVAYWYQTLPHAAFPALPPLEQRIPRIYAVGGPGNAVK